ncbi:hypothetical protein BDK51DRAFT_44545 [Blyttiomyces helicus]|uniref:Uncharacterized protein n=1 Tax=Blyttiomyces helicus TaxID=388810 RepID=A0A4P9WID1_9FUNG|nr:hypothetical protein BDK51DRAFT_44545 [Blyttiomyces helicus]|eukprot:RKO92629.1 hypothetical protein BDK51DRAFT_44545 [Blyttiomyces helicus]
MPSCASALPTRTPSRPCCPPRRHSAPTPTPDASTRPKTPRPLLLTPLTDADIAAYLFCAPTIAASHIVDLSDVLLEDEMVDEPKTLSAVIAEMWRNEDPVIARHWLATSAAPPPPPPPTFDLSDVLLEDEMGAEPETLQADTAEMKIRSAVGFGPCDVGRRGTPCAPGHTAQRNTAKRLFAPHQTTTPSRPRSLVAASGVCVCLNETLKKRLFHRDLRG